MKTSIRLRARSPTLIEMQRQFLISQSAEQQAKLAEIERQRVQKEAERATITATIAKIKATIPMLQQRVDIRKYLTDKELGSKLQYLTELQDLVGMQQDLLVQKSRYHEADAAVAALSETRAKFNRNIAAPCSMSWQRPNRKPPASRRMS